MLQKLIPRIFLLVITLLIFSCTINEPYLPAWDTRVKLHFREDQFSMSEVLTESSFKDSLNSTLGDTLIYVSISDSTEPQAISEDDLAFKSDDDQIVETMGTISLDAPSPQNTPDVTLLELFPDLPPAGNQIPPFDSVTIEPPGNNVKFDSFERVVIETGQMHLVFHNNLILEIDSGLVVSVFDSVSTLLIGQFLFSEKISPGTSKQSSTLDLDDQTLSNTFILNYSIPFTGTDTVHTIKQSDLESSFTTEVVLSAIDVSSATAEIPEQIVEREDTSPINTEDKTVTLAKIREGGLTLNIQNNLEINSDLVIEILTMVDDLDQPKTVNVDLFANQATVKQIDIKGFTIKNHLTPGAAVDEIAYKITATTHPSDGFATVSSTDDIVVDMTMDSTFVSYFEGSVSNVKIDIDPVEQEDLVDLTDLDGSFKLPDLVFTLNFYNQINFDVDLDLTLTGINTRDNKQVVLNVDETLFAGNSDNQKLTVITLNKDNSNIVDLMAILPTSIKMEGSALINGSGSVATSDAIWSDYSIESPLKVKIDEDISIKTDKDSIAADDLEDDVREGITEDLNDVFIHINTENGLPLGASFKFFLAADSTTLYDETILDSTKKVIISADLIPGETDENGLVTLPANEPIKLGLSQQQLQIFNTKPIYYGAVIKINANEKAVTFRKHDLLKYGGFIDIKVRVNSDE
ncbi:MAG: hypothetical protein D8M58_18060 [Calditrichaeota bacterium]|nr:MAG: hypothetical protein DWQ03_11290 [Calditrichota bacterium]MBL1207314.1 hypothetical protein [Calditrichota bacterium]